MKKIFAWLLACAVLVSCLSIPASADIFAEKSLDNYSVEELSQMPYSQLLAGSDDKTIVEEHPYEPSAEEKQLEGDKEATVVEYSDGTEGIIYRIPIYDTSAQTRSVADTVAYVDVSLQGDGSSHITAKVWRMGNIGSCNLNIKLKYGTCRIETPTNVKDSLHVTSIGPAIAPTKLTVSVSTTKFFIVNITGTFMDNQIDYKTYNHLFNKKAVKYPEYTDPVSGIKCVAPYYSNYPRTDSVAWSGRAAYIKWYNNKYSNNMDWNDYDVHHIRARSFGGQNDYSNLIPMPKPKHKVYNAWWLNY